MTPDNTQSGAPPAKSTAKAPRYELVIDTLRYQPVIKRDLEVDWEAPHGTRVAIELEGTYKKAFLP